MLLNKVEVLINTFILTEEAFFHFSYYFPFEYRVSLFLLLYVPEYMLDYLCVCSYERETERVCVCVYCLLYMYYKTVCKYFTSRSWTFDKNCTKAAENRSIWDKSLIRRSPCKIAFVTTSGQDTVCAIVYYYYTVCTFNDSWFVDVFLFSI